MEALWHMRPESLENVPLFLLPGYVLFPNTLVPFHVFEPRYASMIDECLAERRLLVVCGLRPGWEDREAEPASNFEIGGLGRIISDRRLRNGRMNIFVHCVARVRIERDTQTEPFRRADVRVLEDMSQSSAIAALEEAYERLEGLAASLAREMGTDGGALSKVLGSSSDPAVLSHRLAAMMIRDPGHRQDLLELTSPLVRCDRMCDALAERLIERLPSTLEGTGWIN